MELAVLPPFTCGESTRSVGRGVSVEAHRTLAQHRCQPEHGGIAWQQPTEQLGHAARDHVRPHLQSRRERRRATRWKRATGHQKLVDERPGRDAGSAETMLTTASMPWGNQVSRGPSRRHKR
jgi:hypothetical protein